MANAKRTTSTARGERGVRSLRRAFLNRDRVWETSKRRYEEAVSSARAQYPKPPEPVERILLLNQDLFDGKVYEPIPEHEAMLIGICQRKRGEDRFAQHYELLIQWREWQSRCERIDDAWGVVRLKAVNEIARCKRDEAREAFEATPAASVDDIVLKLQHFLAANAEDHPRTLLWRMIGELRRSPPKVL